MQRSLPIVAWRLCRREQPTRNCPGTGAGPMKRQIPKRQDPTSLLAFK